MRLFVDRLRQQRKGERALLLFEVNVRHIVVELQNKACFALQNIRNGAADAVDLVGETALHAVQLAAQVVHL